MIEVLEFVFHSFWRWLGFAILVGGLTQVRLFTITIESRATE